MPKKPVSAVLFDLDGTTRDSRQAITAAVEYALMQHGFKRPSRAEQAEYIHNLRAFHGAFARGVDYETFKASYMQKLESMLGTIVVYKHVAATLKELKASGYKIAMVSSSNFAQEALVADGLEHLFDVIITGKDVIQHKPEPEALLLACERLSIKPETCVIVGDLATDIQAGKAAGIRATIGVTHGFGGREMLEKAHADYIIDSFETLPDLLRDIK